jgi:hypothetical protein
VRCETPSRSGHGAGAFELLDEVTHLRAGGLGDGAGEGLLYGAVEAVSDDAHTGSPFMIGWAGRCGAIMAGPGEVPSFGLIALHSGVQGL